MTEREKMENHMLYDANYDRELEAERIKCKTLCQKYNTLPVGDMDGRKKLIKGILGSTGKNILIEPLFWFD